MSRPFPRCALLALAVGLSLAVLSSGAAGACDRPACAGAKTKPPSKPLDLGQFMRRPSAAAGGIKTQHRRSPPAIPTPPVRATLAGVSEPVKPPGGAPAVTPQTEPQVEVVPSGELNAIDLAAGPAPAETVGSAATGSDKAAVQLVDAMQFNVIDQASSGAGPALSHSRAGEEQVRADGSWLAWFWSKLRSVLDTIAEAVRQLAG